MLLLAGKLAVKVIDRIKGEPAPPKPSPDEEPSE
jgi:hypothetical protein